MQMDGAAALPNDNPPRPRRIAMEGASMAPHPQFVACAFTIRHW
ncbi:MAG: hypothetical protein JWN02_1593 [Acidobacteria bacterium]|nr:hypothetical protein [Acidobacteriota bacterium]